MTGPAGGKRSIMDSSSNAAPRSNESYAPLSSQQAFAAGSSTPGIIRSAEVLPPPIGWADIELDRVRHIAPGKLIVHFSAGEDRWTIELRSRQLQTFVAFQTAVADALGLWVGHESQDARRARDRRESWDLAVALAFGAGAIVT
jgi:hypothetical protein